tara:strand:- start:1011 stop:1187 length:177 start_codon:yes stop_codon:yes gene_type:complete
MSLKSWRDDEDDLELGSTSTIVVLVVTGSFLPGAWPVDPRQNSMRLLVDESKIEVTAM